MRKTTRVPRARADGLIVKELADELLVYDIQRDKAHCLNLTAAAVWKQCDGRATVPEIARRLEVSFKKGQETEGSRQRVEEGNSQTVGEDLVAEAGTIDERVVWLALAQLRRSYLLEEPVDSAQWPQTIMGMSRREAIRRIGIGAAIALPIVATITAPTPAQAGTCGGAGNPCGTGTQCCSGVCSGGSCLGGASNRKERLRRL
jgi:hypothetical protein